MTDTDFFSDLLNSDTATRHIEQGSEDWDKIRCGRFTASEIYKIMEPGKREMSAKELSARPKTGTGSKSTQTADHSKLTEGAETYIKIKVAETLTGQMKKSSYAFPLVYGKETEDEAAEYFEKETGLATERVGFQTFGDHAGGSPDRFVGEDAGLEIKCPYTSEMQIDYLMLTDRFDLKRMFPAYYWQVQSNLLFSGKKLWHFITYDPRFVLPKHRMTHLEIPPVEEDHNLIIMKLELAIESKLKLIKTLS